MNTETSNRRKLVDFVTEGDGVTLKGQAEISDDRITALSGEFYDMEDGSAPRGNFQIFINPYRPDGAALKADVITAIAETVTSLNEEEVSNGND
jgi:hypothetical protein